ncbi:39S ribosomal protein L16, mitochondrial [Recurvomyces mirabilis]|uniref:39S ribosomal protein L16, mitochondrial n=1 Tax=Recurvomyces mirabilis TaxID=574656 RepID=A0AAE0WNS3_9PEZI|nr:39S ribosomal protein L16, mitochondrial [Recurvomyces mirabilis]KAK5158338.1 39S ribosomal protein L16, mitochondrial [Recurvomyces mirabilis]
MAAQQLRPLSTSLLSSFTTRACCLQSALQALISTTPSQFQTRAFSSTPKTLNWLSPKAGESSKSRKGRPRVPTGGSTRGTTLVWGDYGIRLKDHDRRISASQLKIADATIRQRLRGMKYRLYARVSANIGVYTSGNDQRMGKGKGSFDYWCARVPVSRVIFELKGDVHEAVVKDAMRIAGNKLPGTYEFVRKNDPPMMGITKLTEGYTEEMLRRPRMDISKAAMPNLEGSANRMDATV